MGLLNPSEFMDGGIINDVDVDFRANRFVVYDYGGKSEAVPALRVSLSVEGEEEVREQYWSVGGADKWQPSEDGKRLLPIGSATHLNTNSNIFYLMKSLVDAGFPADKLSDDVSVLDGLKAHMVRVPVKRDMADAGGRKKDNTVLVVQSIISLPWEGKGKGKGKGQVAKAPVDDVAVLATAYVEKMLAAAIEEGVTTIPKNQIMTKCYNQFGLKDDPNKAAITKTLVDDAFLKREWEVAGVVWEYANGELALA